MNESARQYFEHLNRRNGAVSRVSMKGATRCTKTWVHMRGSDCVSRFGYIISAL